MAVWQQTFLKEKSQKELSSGMEYARGKTGQKKKIALVAHDHKKRGLVEWARENREVLIQHELCATGITGSLLEKELALSIDKLQSGPLGGDMQLSTGGSPAPNPHRDPVGRL